MWFRQRSRWFNWNNYWAVKRYTGITVTVDSSIESIYLRFKCWHTPFTMNLIYYSHFSSERWFRTENCTTEASLSGPFQSRDPISETMHYYCMVAACERILFVTNNDPMIMGALGPNLSAWFGIQAIFLSSEKFTYKCNIFACRTHFLSSSFINSVQLTQNVVNTCSVVECKHSFPMQNGVSFFFTSG